MSLSLALLEHPSVPLVGWTLLHFLWQGAVVATMLALALRLPALRPAVTRYLAACLALLLMATCPAATLFTLHRSNTLPPRSGLLGKEPDSSTNLREFSRMEKAEFSPFPIRVNSRRLVDESVPSAGRSGFVESVMPVVVAVWFCGVLLLSLRLLGGWAVVQRLGRGRVQAVERAWEERLAALAARLGVERRVRLLQSAAVSVPMVMGCVRAVILVPAGALSGLPPAHLEALLAHELAHVRRHDYLVNLLQTMAETLLFYHPAVWWVSARIRSEREHCCDDLAIAAIGDRLTYARALAAMEALRGGAMAPALAATDGDLLARVRRILGLPAQPQRPAPSWIGGTIMLALILAAATLTQVAVADRRGSPTPHTTSAPVHVRVGGANPWKAAASTTSKRRQVQVELAATRARRLAPKPMKTPAVEVPSTVIRLHSRNLGGKIATVEAPSTVIALRAPQAKEDGEQRAAAKASAKAGVGSSAVVKGVPGRTISDVAVLDLRGVPSDQVAKIQSVKDVAVVLLDTKNRAAFRPKTLEDVANTMVVDAGARVIVEPFIEISKTMLEAMPNGQKLVLVGIVLFRPDVPPALVTAKLTSLNTTGVLLATEGVRGALLGRMESTGVSVNLPDDSGPLVHSVGGNQITVGYLERLQDNSVYVNVGATQVAADVTEELLQRKIRSYINVGATGGPKKLLELLKSRAVANVGVFGDMDDEDDKDDDEDDEK